MSGTNSLVLNLPNQRASTLSYQAFLVIFAATTISSILIVLYTDFIKNIHYGVFGLDTSSSWHSFILALFMTGIFIIIIYLIITYDLFNTAAANDVGTLTGGFPPGSNLLGSGTTSLNNTKVGSTNLALKANKVGSTNLTTKATNKKLKLRKLKKIKV